jgi:hypothetical protein
MRKIGLLLALLTATLAATSLHAQGVAPGGPIAGSTGIGSGLGPSSVAPGGTAPSYPNGTGTVATPAPAPIPPGGYPPVGRSGDANTNRASPTPVGARPLPSPYLQPRDPFDPTTPRGVGDRPPDGRDSPSR